MKNITNKNKVILGLSGGVDSTAAVLLLKEQGFEVTGAYLDVLGSGPDGARDALAIAGQLEINLIIINISGEFENIVISGFCSEYLNGRTPNPCVICNPEIKFRSLLKAADESGAYYISTGHYANVRYDKKESCYYINKANNEKKDQSYMLYRLRQETLERLLLPLGEAETKGQVRTYVAESGIMNAGAKDSQEICFLPKNTNYADYIKSRGYSGHDGEFSDMQSNIIGRHRGILRYTVGQRKNLGMTFGKPMFVVKIDQEKNMVFLGGNDELFSKEAISRSNNFPLSDGGEMPEKYDGMRVMAKVRYRAEAAEAVISKVDKDTVKTVFANAQRAVTPGQSIVFYAGGKVIGGGIIDV